MTPADINRIFTSHRRRYVREVWIPRLGAALLIGSYLWCVWYGLKVWSEQ